LLGKTPNPKYRALQLLLQTVITCMNLSLFC
jgi:hypothetical protein